MKVLIICVNYNSYKELCAYIDSLEVAKLCSTNDITLDILIADNSEEKQELKKKYELKIEHIFTGENLGYFGGITEVIKKSKYNLQKYDYVILSNVDLLVTETFFDNLYSLEINQNIGCIAPAIYSLSEGKDRNPKVIERYTVKKLKVLCLMYKLPILYYFYTILFYARRRKKFQNSKRGYIYAAHGSFMIFTSKFVSFLEIMRYPGFLFGEEIFIAENLRKKSLQTLYEPSIVVKDLDHVSTRKMKSHFYFKCNYDALNMLLKEYFNE